MRLWPIIPITSSFFLGVVITKYSHEPPPPSVSPDVTVTARPSLLPPNRVKRDTLGILPVSVLKNVSFGSFVDGRLTPIARHTLALTEAQCTAVESAVAKYDAAVQSLDEKMHLQAAVVEETKEQSVISIPDNAKARHAIELSRWESIQTAVGETKTIQLVQERPIFRPWQKLERTLTLNYDEDSAQILKATNVYGKHYNPQRSQLSTKHLESPWIEIVERLGL